MGYGIHRKYLPNWVSVSVTDRKPKKWFRSDTTQMRIQNFDDPVLQWLQANYEYDEKHGQDGSANDKMHSYTRL